MKSVFVGKNKVSARGVCESVYEPCGWVCRGAPSPAKPGSVQRLRLASPWVEEHGCEKAARGRGFRCRCRRRAGEGGAWRGCRLTCVGPSTLLPARRCRQHPQTTKTTKTTSGLTQGGKGCPPTKGQQMDLMSHGRFQNLLMFYVPSIFIQIRA